MYRPSRIDFADAPEMFEDEPVVIEDVLAADTCEQWISHILKRSNKEAVQVERQQQRQHHTLLMPLGQAIEWVTRASTHTDPLCAVSLGSSCSTDQLPLYDTLEELFVDYDEPTRSEDTLDWCACLGRHAAMHDTLTVLGDGARSNLAAYPVTKLILCLQGRQLIRAIPPLPSSQPKQSSSNSTTDNLETSFPATKPIWTKAWEDFSFSMGTQVSDPNLSLFAYQHRNAAPTSSKSVHDFDTLQEWADDPHFFQPNFVIGRSQTPPLIPPLNNEILPNYSRRDAHGRHTAWHSSVLLPGNVAVIPPGWWFQTYQAGSTEDGNNRKKTNVRLMSQRCGGSTRGVQLIQHIMTESTSLSTSRVRSRDQYPQRLLCLLDTDDDTRSTIFSNGDESYYTSDEAQEIVDEVFDILLEEHRTRERNIIDQRDAGDADDTKE